MNYHILTSKRPKPKFEVHFDCVLLDSSGFPAPNPFNQFKAVKQQGYQLNVLPKKSEIGKMADKLSVAIQNSEYLFVVSENLKKILSELNDKIEFHTTSIIKNDEKIDGYYIVNMLQSIDAINYQMSKLIYWDESYETVYNIDSLVLNEKIIPNDYLIFLLENIREKSVIVIHDALKKRLEEANISGIKLCLPENFKL